MSNCLPTCIIYRVSRVSVKVFVVRGYVFFSRFSYTFCSKRKLVKCIQNIGMQFYNITTLIVSAVARFSKSTRKKRLPACIKNFIFVCLSVFEDLELSRETRSDKIEYV